MSQTILWQGMFDPDQCREKQDFFLSCITIQVREIKCDKYVKCITFHVLQLFFILGDHNEFLIGTDFRHITKKIKQIFIDSEYSLVLLNRGILSFIFLYICDIPLYFPESGHSRQFTGLFHKKGIVPKKAG